MDRRVSAPQASLRAALAERTGTRAEDWHLVFRARYGMEVTFRALAQARGRGSVATQLFTCCTAVDPIVAAGLTPAFGDVSPRTLALEAANVPRTDDLLAIVDQHTFGMMDEAADVSLRGLADELGVLLVEDNAHSVARLARDAAGRPVADVSIHSFGVEKMLPTTYFGGAVWVNPAMADAALRQAITAALDSLPAMDASLDKAVRGYRNQLRVLTRLPRPVSRAIRSRMERKRTFVPAVADVERRAGLAHESQGMSDWVATQALEALEGIDANEARRRSCVAEYARALAPAGGVEVPAAAVSASESEPLLRFPVLLPTQELADEAIALVARMGYYAVPWYRPLLTPGVLDAQAYGWDPQAASWPTTMRASRGIVCLPTDIQPQDSARVADALLDLVESN